MKIVSVRLNKKDKTRCLLSLDDGSDADITVDALVGHRLSVGCEVDCGLIARLERERAVQSASSRGYDLLSYRQHSKKELVGKLIKKGEDPEAAGRAVERLCDMGVLDEREYASDRAAQLIKKGCSPAFAARELIAKGIDRQTAQEAAFSRCPDAEGAVRAFIEKRARGPLDDRKERDRITRALLRYGWKYDEFRHILDEYAREEGFCE